MMRLLIILSLLLLPCVLSAHEDGLKKEKTIEAVKEEPFRILSWNIYTLPRWLLPVREGPIRRARKMTEVFLEKEYDVLVLQEAFDGRVRRIIRRHLKEMYPYEYGPANKRLFSFRTNSGIWILSRHPMKFIDEIKYDPDKTTGWDSWSRKGALMVEVDFNGQPVHIIGTHLQAGGGEEGHYFRYSQNKQIREELIDVHSKPEIPVLLCGDFNIRRSNTEWYEKMLEVLGADDGPFLSEQQYTSDHRKNEFRDSDRGSIIDYIFVIDEAQKIERFERYVRILRKRWSKQYTELSDHFAVEGKLWLKP